MSKIELRLRRLLRWRRSSREWQMPLSELDRPHSGAVGWTKPEIPDRLPPRRR